MASNGPGRLHRCARAEHHRACLGSLAPDEPNATGMLSVTALIAKETVLVKHKLAAFATSLVAILAISGCAFPDRGTSVPEADTARALPLGIANARFFADGDPKPMIEEGMRALDREEAAL